MLTVMSTMVIAPALPQMAQAFAATPDADLLVRLSITTPALAIMFMAPLAGWAIDRLGRLRILYASMLLYSAAGVAGYFLDSLPAILFSRLLLGVAIAGTMTAMNTLSGDYYHGEQRLRFAGLQALSMSIGAMLLVGLAGVIADIHWRWTFLLYLLGWLLLLPVALTLTEPRREAAPEPVLPAQAHAARRSHFLLVIGSAYLLSGFASLCFYMVASQLPFLVRDSGTHSGLLLGVAVGMVQLAAALGSAWYARLKRRCSYLAVFAVAYTLMGVGYGVIALLPGYAAILVGAGIAGIGVGLFFPNGAMWVLSVAPAAMRGRCSGGLSAALNVGQFLSPIALYPVVMRYGTANGFALAALCLLLIAAGIVLALRWRSARPTRT